MAVVAARAVAFKEWAVVVEALLDGRQVVTLRKGGISEEGGRFVPPDEMAPAFWLFPTYEHQSDDVLARPERGRYGRALAARPPEGLVEIPGRAECAEAFEVRTEEAARRLAAETIWTEETVAARFRMMPGRPLYAMVLRVFRLPRPVRVPAAPSYGGCKSWVPLEASAAVSLPDPTTAAPVLDVSTFAARRDTIRSLVAGA